MERKKGSTIRDVGISTVIEDFPNKLGSFIHKGHDVVSQRHLFSRLPRAVQFGVIKFLEAQIETKEPAAKP